MSTLNPGEPWATSWSKCMANSSVMILPCWVIAFFTASLSSKLVTLLVAVIPEVGSDCGERVGPVGKASALVGVVVPFLAAWACRAGVSEPARGTSA